MERQAPRKARVCIVTTAHEPSDTRIFHRQAKTVTTVAVFVYLCYASWILNSVSFATVLVTFGFMLALGTLVVERIIRGSRRGDLARARGG